MSDQSASISKAFQVFMTDAPKHAQAWGGMVQALASASALDDKTAALAYLAVLARAAVGERCALPRPTGQTAGRIP